ncbi:hypothetical protein [Amycolatopsis sp.]|uniref:hypothetical protein n=1 Tax=Amycolatopsis sp. TaxID=37632 RepID=UPI002D808BD8|nr:hypothetical protein [Amycolatopsis sp.]HET6705057.1 hypothetical protein [Amycolatopsis sp.]
MTLFLASWGANDEIRARALETLREYVREFPGTPGRGLRETEWTGPVHVAWVSGDGPATAEESTADRLSLVDGVAIGASGDSVVTAAAVASGPPGELCRDPELDGQFAILDATRSTLDIAVDTLGLCLLHWCRTPDGWFVSNRVEPLARLAGKTAIDEDAATAFLSVGWVTGERTLVAGVRTVPGGAHWSWRPEEEPVFAKPRDPLRIIGMPRASVDIPALRDDLVARCAAVGDWLGGVESGLTSGLDSRLLFMVLRAADVNTVYITGGAPDSPDVRVSRQIADTYGIDRRYIPPLPEDEIRANWHRISRQLLAQNDGMVSLWQASDLMRPPVAAPVSLWGVGGAIGRSFYGMPRDLLEFRRGALRRRFVDKQAKDADGLLTAEGTATIRRRLRGFADDVLAGGTPPGVLSDAFLTLELIGRWAAPNAHKIHPVPVFAPLSTRPWLRAAFSMSPVRRYSEPLHYRLFQLLAPGEDIANHPSGQWRSQLPYLNLCHGYARQKVLQNSGRDPLGFRARILEDVRRDVAARCLDRKSSSLWNVVSRPVFEAVMSDRTGPERRAPMARSLYAAITLFEYEALRTGSFDDVASPVGP